MFNIHDVNHYYDAGIASLNVVLDYNKLCDRERSAVLRSLDTGVIPTHGYNGAGRYAADLFKASGALYLQCSATARWRSLHWCAAYSMPAEIYEPLADFVIADHVTAQLTQREASQKLMSRKDVIHQLRKQTGDISLESPVRAKSADSLRSIMKPHVGTPEYRARVAAAVCAVKNGESLRFSVA